MPTQNRRDWIVNKARHEFRTNKGETDKNQIEFYATLAATQLETIEIQVGLRKLT